MVVLGRRFRAALATVALVSTAKEASADLYFENRTNETVSVAVAWANGPNTFMASGWYTLLPREKKGVISGNIENKYVNFYAETAGKGGTWEGGLIFTVHPEMKFEIEQDVNGKAIRWILPNGGEEDEFRQVRMRTIHGDAYHVTERLYLPK